MYCIPGIYMYIYTWYICWVDVGWRRRCETNLSLRELDSQGAVFFSWRLSRLAVELDHFCGENLYSAQGGRAYHVVCIW